MTTFADLGVPSDLIEALAAQGIDEPFTIQTATIRPALAGRDVSGRAPTGSGKTLAFGVPLVANVQRARPKRPRALVLVPTRELAAQVSHDLALLGAHRDVRVHAFYGGTKFEPQVKALRRGVDIAVACPGRLADLIDQGIARLDGVDLVVVDEADRMADMGFLPEVRRLVDQTDAGRQTMLFSATLDGDVDALVRRYQHDPVTIDVTAETTEAQLEHYFWSVPHPKRVEVTARIVERVGPTVVFTRTRYGADRVATQLGRAGVDAVAIHGNRTQSQREHALDAFRSGQSRALVATDVAARGIHVDNVACVVHFDLPADPKDFVHRSGRTGRAGASGVVVALAMPDRRTDNDKLFRSLDVEVTLTDPDFDLLPIGPASVPRRSRRSDPAGGRGPGTRRTEIDKGGRHKPFGYRQKPRAESPADTRPGKNKSAPSRPRQNRDDATPRHSDPGTKPDKRHEATRDDRSSPGDRARWDARRDRPEHPRSAGPGADEPTPGGGKGQRPESTDPKPKRTKAKGSKPGRPKSKKAKAKAKAKRAEAAAAKRKPKNRARNAPGQKSTGQAKGHRGHGRPGQGR